jgi:hypothetical protein
MPKRACLLLIFVAGCASSGDSLSAPTASYNVYLVFTPVAPGPTGFTVQLDGKTYDSAGATTVTLSSGTHEMDGSFRGSGFVVGFSTIDTGGGVKSGSVRSLGGPSPKLSACSINYATDTPNDQHSFQVQFTVDAKSSGTLCGGTVP